MRSGVGWLTPPIATWAVGSAALIAAWSSLVNGRVPLPA